jgi:hypothetical protein
MKILPLKCVDFTWNDSLYTSSKLRRGFSDIAEYKLLHYIKWLKHNNKLPILL